MCMHACVMRKAVLMCKHIACYCAGMSFPLVHTYVCTGSFTQVIITAIGHYC